MLPVRVNGEYDIILPRHRAERAEWTSAEGWERARLASMRANIRPGDVVYDIGGEEGDMSGLLAMWVREKRYMGDEFVTLDGCGQEVPGSRHQEPDRVVFDDSGGIVIVEPNPRVWSNIRAIFEANDLPLPLARVVGFAGNEDRHSADWDNEYVWPSGEDTGWWPACSSGPVIGDHGFLNLCERPDVPIVRLDDLAARTVPPTAITVDVEGAELAVMRGAEQTLREHRPLVWISVHPEFMQAMYDQYANDLYSFMHSCGYLKRWLAFDHELHVAFVAEEKRDEFVLQERPDWT